MWIFLQPWLCRSLSTNFQLILSENFSTCRCIVFHICKGGKLHILLFCHVDSDPKCSILLWRFRTFTDQNKKIITYETESNRKLFSPIYTNIPWISGRGTQRYQEGLFSSKNYHLTISDSL